MIKSGGFKVTPALLVAISISSLAQALEATADLNYAKPLNTPALTQESLVAAPLDSDVYQATQPELHDLRLIDAAAKEVPYLLRKAATTQTESAREAWTARKEPTIVLSEDGELQITLELERQEPTPTGLRLVTPLRNFEHRVRVEYSSDGDPWETLIGDGLVFDYSKYIDVRSDTVEWKSPSDTAPVDDAHQRRIRITIDSVTQAQESELLELTRRLRGGDATDTTERLIVDRRPFRIERIEFFRDDNHARVTGERLADYGLTDMTVAQDAEAKQTLISVGSRREPLTMISIDAASRNFSRAARVEIPQLRNGRSIWQTIGAGNIARIDIYNLDRTDLALSIPETRRSHYRVVIENRDSPPLEIKSLAAQGPIYEVVFLADPRGTYRLTYGGASEVPAPSYDTAALSASLAAGHVPLVATLGEQIVMRSGPGHEEPVFKRLLNDPRLLTAVIGALVLLLGFGLYQASRRVNRQFE